MADQILNVTIKGIGDFSDVVSNVNNVQKALTKLKLPDKLGDNLNKKISAFGSEYEKYQKKISEGIKTQGDYNQVEKSLNRMRSLYQEIGQDVSKISRLDMDSILNLDLGEFKQLRNEIANIEKEINKIQIGKINPKAIEDPMKALRSSLKSKKFSEKDTGLLDQLIGNVKSGKVQEAKAVLNELDSAVKKITPPKNADGSFMEKVVGKLNPGNAKAATGAIEQLKQVLSSTDEEVKPLITVLDQLQKEFAETQNNAKGEILGGANKFKETENEVNKVTDSLKQMHQEEFSFNRQVQDIDRQIQSYFGLSQMIRKVGDIARDAFNTVKELDQAMTETAVVTNFSVGDMWNMLPTYTEQANKLGATIKDVYEAATLYYQQGLNTNQAMGLANETLKMARIAGMDAAEATDMMTSALRGFNMEINQTSAQKVNDIYSQLAAVTASDTRELGTAMEKTASLASSANMDIETTSAFLAQMIETTREAPENLGTAMKTIIARFQEMKKDPTSLVDAEGVAMDVNKVDTALKSIGVALTNSKGEFRDLDDVFLDISKRWDSLSQGQQRYIATTAAGSRQQSRFIAMMSNYDRTMELVNEANNSAGASQKQFEKTMDSMSSKLNQLKNAWDEFTMGLMNNQILKAGVDGLTQFFTVVNKIIDALSNLGGKINDPLGGIAKSALTLVATLGGLNFGKKMAGGTIAAGLGWWNNDDNGLRGNFMKGYGVPNRSKVEDIYKKKLNKLEERRKSKVEAKADIKVKAGTVDTSEVDKKVKVAVKKDIEDDPPIEAKKEIKVEQNTSNYGSGYIPFQRDENGKLKVQKSSEVTTLPNYNSKPIETTGKAAIKAADHFASLGNNIADAGYALQLFGDQLGPLGGIFSTIGTAMVSFGTTISSVSAAASAAMADGVAAGAAWKGAILSTIGPILAVGAAVGLIAGAIYLADKAIETDKEKIERLTNSANAASDAYDSLKQESSELKDSLESIQSNEDSFEGLVAGTTEFNDKLTETNQKIDELIQKYPELNKYLSIDKNGLKHISQKGIDFIQEQQDKLVGNASAQNILQNARLKAEQDRQKIKQNKKEIHGIEYTRVADEGGGYDIKKSSLTTEEQKRIDQLEQESKYLKENLENSEKIATQQALAASFTNIEASDRERLASMYVDSYEAAKKRAEVEKDEGKMLQTYADYYGYQYDAASKKVLDSTGKEIEIDKEALRSVYSDIVATIDIQASAESLDKIENDVNQKFSKGLNLDASRGDNVLSGVLSGDVETNPELVKKLAEQSSENIQETLNKLTDEELSALTGREFTDDERSDVVKEFASKIKDKALNTLDAQSQIYEELGAKIAKTEAIQPIDTTAVSDNVVTSMKENLANQTQEIANKIGTFTVEQANILNNVAGKIEENVGLDTMDTFLDNAISIYQGIDENLKKEFNNLLSGIEWESASSRLAGYTKAIKSSEREIRVWGKEMKTSASEANILGEAFDEFVGGDWQELSKKAEDFQNSVGEIDGSGILKAAEQSGSLKNLLDSGAVSATGVAMALQGIEEGKYSIGEVDGAVLQLLSSLNRLEDASLEAHNFISNFDPGIDTGEGEDFIKNSAKAVQEFMDNNEWGNDQLQNYIKAAAGEELWYNTLKKHKGDLKKTTKDLDQYVTKFKDGFLPAYKEIISGKGINGKSLTENIDKAIKDKDISKKLGDKMKGVTAEWDENGFLQWDFNGLTTNQLEKFFQEAYGVSEEYAKLFLQDIKNYNETEGAQLAKNDLQATIQSKDFQETRGAFGDKSKLILTDEDIRIFEAAGGSLEELAEAAKVSKEELEKNQFKVYDEKTGERRTDYKDLLRDYAGTFQTGKKTISSLFDVDELLTGGKLDLNKLIADTQSKSFDEEQSMQAAYKAYRVGQKKGETTLYEGMAVESGITNYEDFKAALEHITETSQWVQVGETIGSQIVNALNASNFLERVRSGEENVGKAFEDDGNTTTAFQDIIAQIAQSGENQKQQQEDVTTYLEQSKTLFEGLNPREQTAALEQVVAGLNQLNFKPEEIAAAISDGLGVGLTKNDLNGEQGKFTLDENFISASSEKIAATIKEQAEFGLTDLKPTIAKDELAATIKEQAQFGLSDLKANVSATVTTITVGDAAATGQNNPNSAFHRVGTMARGSRRGYTISGRPTLTGEEGEELVWEPKRNEAYMVGSKGPQFANISKDAVVWNADQTKRIKKNSNSVGHIGTGARGITPFGTMASGTKISGTGILDVMANIIGFNGLNGDKKDQGLTIDVTAVVNTLDVKEEAKIIKGLKGEITAEKVNKSGQIEGEPVKLSGVVENISISVKDKEKKDKPQKVTQTVETKVKNNAQKEIDNTKRTKGPVEIKTKASKDAQNAINKIEGKRIEIHIKPIFEGTWEKTATIKVETQKVPGKAKGQNNYIQYHSAPTFGSAAKGYGTVGPKNKGGLTLTGEKGYEIAWLPSENRSMILGVGGPQMITLPDDAVVYTHEQSKDIIKRKGIPAGSHSGRTNRDDTTTTTTTSSKPSKTSGGKSDGDAKKKKDPKKDDKKEKANTSAISKIIVWWDNITRRADATQRKADKNQKTYEKYLKDIKATLKDTGTIGGGNDFISNTNNAIDLYNEQLNQAAFELKNLTIGTKEQRNAAKTKTRKDDKKANKRAFLNEAGGAVKISYNKKSGKKKKSVNQIIDTAKYIKEQDGTYVIDQSQLNRIKNGEKRKALADALNKEINDRISKKNAAEDNIEKANEALEKFSEELYNTFFAWENELTKIWNITQKIEQAQSRMSRNDAYDELLKAQLSTGKLTAGAESRNKDLTNFRSRLETQNNLLKERQEAITESQKNVQRILTSEDEKQTLANVNNKLNANAKATQKLNALNNAKQAKQAYDNAIKNRDTTQKNINKIQAKIIKLKDKKNLSNADQEEIKKLRKQRDKLKKTKESYDKIIKDNKSLASKVNQLQLEYNNVKGSALDATQKGAYEKYQKALTDQITAQEWGRKFANPQMRADGTIDIQFNTEAFETARTNGAFTGDMAKAIQDWVKELQEASNNLQQSYEDLTKEVTEYYTQLDTLQQEWADYGKELTEITETYEKEKIDKIKQLSDEIKKTLDKLLNDVKRNLDERRRQQENTKTEQDISQKQQRLAALRADTSGGHQVEIAQLEKEIAEAQQNYQNSLEDQLLDKIQQQADLAAEQRERQIELQEMLVNSVSNIEKVNEWMIQAQGYSDLEKDKQEAFKEEIRTGYRSKNNYDQLTKAERDEVDTNFEEFFHGLVTNSEKQKELNLAIGGLEGTLRTLDGYLQKQNQPAASSGSTSGGGNAGGGNAGGRSAGGGSTGGGSTGGGNKTNTTPKTPTPQENYLNALKDVKKLKPNKVTSKNINTLFDLGSKANYSKKDVLSHLLGNTGGSNPFTWKNIFSAIINANGITRYNLVKTFGDSGTLKEALATLNKPNTIASIRKAAAYKTAKAFATGGLANFTGPAWLDGTPSKPELVLNSTDTRNFIALRDVLSKVMSSSGSTENSYATTEFNIHINIEKVADDYDVDKIITKVKKEITKSAGYRNVTQVRSFR